MIRPIFLLLFLTISSSGFTQQAFIGIKGGLNYSNLLGDVENNQFRPGFHGGVYGCFRVTQSGLAIQPEVVYSNQGSLLEDSDQRYFLKYLNFPVVLKYPVLPDLNLFTGPQLGILLDSELDMENNASPVQNFQFKQVDLSWSIGLDYYLGTNFVVESRANLGINNIHYDDNRDLTLRNIVLQFGIRYRLFPIRRIVIKRAVPN